MRTGRGIVLLLLFGVALARSVPAPAGEGTPAFELPDLAGKRVSLASFLGKKPVLLAFWATWCPHCNESVPEINRIHAAFGNGERLQVLALDFKESPEKVGSFVRKKQVSYPVLLDRKGAVAREYRILGIPTYILIGRDGRIVYRGYEPPDLSPFLEPAPPGGKKSSPTSPPPAS
ncbi:MAG: hypothetical protein Kow00128_22300 [Deltaproteobacteria bacterium]